ncbi:MAG: FAD-dependent oxidoreductase, partial [Phaeodactylibacter sp.]|nr:FAD-dependent oxidoreductase [Phaeodactylibacter sp.]
MKINIPETGQERIVIVGGGFGGLTLARELKKQDYQVVLIDKNNYHQFQPLFYQVAMSGLEPSSIVFPFRKAFQGEKNIYIRVTEVESVDTEKKQLQTSLGICNYDYLVLAIGADTNFFGNEEIASKAIPMKSVSEALYLRNRILTDYETALSVTDYDQRQQL